ncbi:MAG: hypothetical protein SFX18_04365 [Pirellulales bacterium]|nr:hypothetical protein [Pirellulales bacterium]
MRTWTITILASVCVAFCAAFPAAAQGVKIYLPGFQQSSVNPNSTLNPGSTAQGLTNFSINFPPGSVPVANPSQLELELDNTWPDGPGYRPLRITVKTTAPVAVDREIQFVYSHRLSQNSWRISDRMILPANAKSAHSMLVPASFFYGNYDFETSIDGKPVPELSFQNFYFVNQRGQFNNTSPFLTLSDFQIPPNYQTVGGDSFQTHVLRVATSPAMANSHLQIANTRSQGQPTSFLMYQNPNFQETQLSSLSELPTNWLGYSTLVATLARPDDLTNLQKNFPPQARALRDWVASGGFLVVEQELPPDPTQGSIWQKVDDWVENVPANQAAENEKAFSGWKVPDRLQNPHSGAQTDDYRQRLIQAGWPADTLIACRPFGSGWVIGVAVEANNNPDYTPILHHLPTWSQQQGVESSSSPHSSNPTDFYIAGVGEPPITAFQILITLFVLFIGPMNLFYLIRKKRLSWLLITIPLSALVITSGLLLYTLYSDGLGVRLRTRSVTWLDQSAERQIVRGRLSYFAGIAPSAGLAFSDQTAIYPLIRQDHNSRNELRLDWLAEGDANSRKIQSLRQGWLLSRVPVQFLTNRVQTSRRQLKFADSSGTLRVQNLLGSKILKALIKDEQGNWHVLANLEDNAAANATAIPAGSVNQQCVDFAKGADLDFFISGGYNSSTSNPFPSLVDPTGGLPQGDPLEAAINGRWLSLTDSAPRRTYYAILEQQPDLELGTAASVEPHGLHLVIGKW